MLREKVLQGKLEQRSQLKSDQNLKLNKIVDKLNEEFLKEAKKIVPTKKFYRDLPSDIQNKILGAQDIGSLNNIILARFKLLRKLPARAKSLVMYEGEFLSLGREVEIKMKSKLEEVDATLAESGKEAVVHSDGKYHVEDMKEMEKLRNKLSESIISIIKVKERSVSPGSSVSGVHVTSPSEEIATGL